MKVSRIALRNFRRLQDVDFTLEDDETLLVGPNNSGKTSATAAFRLFLKKGNFTISDFNVACIRALDDFGCNAEATEVPKIQLDLWLSVDPTQIEFGRAFSLIPNLGLEQDRVGIRLSLEASEAATMREEFTKTFPEGSGKSLTEYLAVGRNLSRHFTINYYALQYEDETNLVEALIEPEEGRKVLDGLIRVDFIDAQRNIHDDDTGRHNRLSSAFAAYYKHNLEKPEENEAATKVIDDNNTSLTAHYDRHFKKLLKNVAKLGVPSAHDRQLRIVSSLSPQEALQGNTELYYEDVPLKHRLPEAYNGLGFKNLVYMAIQISHFHAQWIATEVNRPLCQLIFIEEPEVHLHAQVQQVFIENIYKVLQETATDTGEKYIPPQLVISTHSSHVVNTVMFEKIRYFRRCPLQLDKGNPKAQLIASEVLNLQNFKGCADPDSIKSEESQTSEASRIANLHFLRKYVRLTHSDLFFADAAILVEGAVEKILMTQMINITAPTLASCYLTILEVGGAFAHKFSSLMEFLGIPYLIIADIDTVHPDNVRKACPASQAGSYTSNATLKLLMGTRERDTIIAADPKTQIVEGGRCFVTFQRPVTAILDGKNVEFHGRTLEETFVYENLNLFRSKKISTGHDLAQGADDAAIASETYEAIRSDTFKKTEFALSVTANNEWKTPKYIADGLNWLRTKLAPTVVASDDVPKTIEVA